MRRVARRLLGRATAQMDIAKICGRFKVRVAVTDDERRPPMAQQVDGSIDRKFRAAKLDDVPHPQALDTVRQQLDKRSEGLFVRRRVRWELPQDRTELVAQFEHAARKEPVEGRAGSGEIGTMGCKAGALNREDKILRRLIVPTAEAFGLLRTVECAVDLDCSDLAAGKAELTCLRQASRVKDPTPRRKHPTADSD